MCSFKELNYGEISCSILLLWNGTIFNIIKWTKFTEEGSAQRLIEIGMVLLCSTAHTHPLFQVFQKYIDEGETFNLERLFNDYSFHIRNDSGRGYQWNGLPKHNGDGGILKWQELCDICNCYWHLITTAKMGIVTIMGSRDKAVVI